MLSVRSLSKRFGSIAALRDASFGVGEGEVLGVVGPTGAGKTTLFQCLAGLLAPDSGAVLYGQRELEPGAMSSLLFFLPKGISPWNDQPVAWVLDFTSDALRAERNWRGELAEVLRLAELKGRRVGELTRGQRQRALLAVALLSPRRVTLFDEPFAGLDPKHAREVAAYFRAQTSSGQGRTIVVSSDSMHGAQRACDRFVLLNDGAVIGEGTLDELRTRASTPGAHLDEVFLALA